MMSEVEKVSIVSLERQTLTHTFRGILASHPRLTTVKGKDKGPLLALLAESKMPGRKHCREQNIECQGRRTRE